MTYAVGLLMLKSILVYTLRLIGPISYLGACYIQTKVTKCIREKMTLYTFMDKPLHHIRQNTKSARLIAVCKRSNSCPTEFLQKWISHGKL